MNINELYQQLVTAGKISAETKTLNLDADYLKELKSVIDTQNALHFVFCYFEKSAISINNLKPIESLNDTDPSIVLEGQGNSLPFTGMSVRMELRIIENKAGSQELGILLEASGGGSKKGWKVSEAFPFHQNASISSVQFMADQELKTPFLSVASHEFPNRAFIKSMFFFGLLDLDTIQGGAFQLLIGTEGARKLLPMKGTITVIPPSEGVTGNAVQPYISFLGGLPEAEKNTGLLSFFPLENRGFSLNALPDYNLATRRWESDTSILWTADLAFEVSQSASPTGKAEKHTIPIGAEMRLQHNQIRFWSNLEEGISLAMDGLSGLFKDTVFAIPTSDFRLDDYIQLKKLEFLVDTGAKDSDLIEYASLDIQTNEDKHQWVLIERLLVLQAIDFFILIRRPFNAQQRSLDFSLSGLIGIGESGTLRLTASFSKSGDETDYAFHGALLDNPDGSKLNIKEVFEHFLGKGNHPELPNLDVDAFLFSLQPKTKDYSGEIELIGDWKISESAGLSLEKVFFSLSHSGEGDIVFQANAAFTIAGAALFISADYESIDKGWTFAGGTYESGEIPIGEWVKELNHLVWSNSKIALPQTVNSLSLRDLGVRFNTQSKAFSFHGTASFSLSGDAAQKNNANLTILLDMQPPSTDPPASGSFEFGGSLEILNRKFLVAFEEKEATSFLVAAYDDPSGDKIRLDQLIQEISPQAAELVKGISIELKHAQLAYLKKTDKSLFLFGMEMGAGIELSKLPLVGQAFSREQTLSIALNILAGQETFSKDDIGIINQLTPAATTPLPAEADIDFTQQTLHLKVTVRLGNVTLPVPESPLQVAASPSSTSSSSSPPQISGNQQDSASNAMVKWVDVQKTFGPFHFLRLGIGFDSGNIELLFDASLMAAGLTLSLEGLGAECALSDLSAGNYQPSFHLDGIGVGFNKGALKISGGLLRIRGENGYQYDGSLTLEYEKLGISALGSYWNFNGHPSLFVYALMDYPLGGPSFFFIEGLAAGFGYNRSLRMPGIDGVATFPLVSQALQPPAQPLDPMKALAELKNWIAEAEGEYFLAIGVKFSSFKLINSFALLAVQFGEHFEIDVLGMSTLELPSENTADKPPLAVAKLMLMAKFAPDEGILQVQARLSNDSHVFSKDCHLTGGFAFYSWFDNAKQHAGDFVLTLGGYHQDYKVPEHYPTVPRLGMNWQVNSNLSIKADAYFALTPHALMGGGHLAADWRSGDLHAWFYAGIDFLMCWQPYHYDGRIYVSVGASYSIFKIELSADLHIWGPEFSGKAHLKWFIISFDVTFGSQASQALQPIAWSAFKAAFLPKDNNVCTLSIKKGRVTQHGRPVDAEKDITNVINPRELCIAVHTVIPIKESTGQLFSSGTSEEGTGIAPMAVKKGEWKSTLSIDIKREGGSLNSFPFAAIEQRQSVPRALWDDEIDPAKREKGELLADKLTGYDIHIKNPLKKFNTHDRNQNQDTYQHHSKTLEIPDAWYRAAITDNKGIAEIKETVHKPEIRQKRETVLADFDLETVVDWSGMTANALHDNPRFIKLTQAA